LNLDDPAVVAAVHVIEVMTLVLVVLLIWRVIDKYRNSDAPSLNEKLRSADSNYSSMQSSHSALEQMFLDTPQNEVHSSDMASDQSPELLSRAAEQSIKSESSQDKTLDNYIDDFFGPRPK